MWIPLHVWRNHSRYGRLGACVASFSTMGSNCSVRQAPSKWLGQLLSLYHSKHEGGWRERKERICTWEANCCPWNSQEIRYRFLSFSRSSHVLISTWGPTQSMDASQKSNLGFLVKEMCLWSWQPLSLCKFYGMWVRWIAPWLRPNQSLELVLLNGNRQ